MLLAGMNRVDGTKAWLEEYEMVGTEGRLSCR